MGRENQVHLFSLTKTEAFDQTNVVALSEMESFIYPLPVKTNPGFSPGSVWPSPAVNPPSVPSDYLNI
jgi:hypothetical protein